MRENTTHVSRGFLLHLFVCVSVVALASAHLLAATRLPSRFVPGDATIAAAAQDQSAPFLAAGGGTVLAVWSDNRANSTGGSEGETSRDIYGMRIDGDGTLLGSVPFAVAAGRASQENPKAAWNGTNWLVVYESYDLGGTGYFAQKSLQAVRVAPNGQVLDTKPIRLYGITPSLADWAVASDGSNWVIAGQGTSVGSEIVAVRISSTGAVLDAGPPLLVPATYYSRSNFHLAYAAGVFLLTYDEMATGSSSTSSLRFDSDLALLDPAPSTLVGSPVLGLASNGSGFYAVWNEQLPNFTMAVKGSRIGTNGQKLDGTGKKISGSNQPQAFETTSVAWDGTYWKVTWGSTSGLRIARVDAAGGVLDLGGVSVPGPQTGPTASAGNGTVQVIWSAFATTNYDVSTAHVSSSNTAGANLALAIGAPAQLQADVAAGASGFMMVYRSTTSSTVRVLAQPLDATGNPTTTEPVVLDTGTGSTAPGAPAVAWNGTLFLAVWPNSSGVVARRLQTNGTPIDPAPFVVLNPGFGSVDVEGLGGNFLVVGLRCGINCEFVFPVAARVRGVDGVVLDPSPISMGVTFCSSPRVAVLGGRWLVVWHDNVSHDDSIAYTRGTFIDTAGAKVPDFIIHGPFSTAGGNGIFTIGLASSGTVALMVQSQELTSGVETDLLGRLIDTAGNVQPYFNLTPWADDQYRPRAAWDGSQFVVVFQDQKTALADQSLEQLDARSDLFGMRITSTGAIVDPQGFLFSNSATGEAYPTVATLGATTLIAGSIVRNDSVNANYRIGYDLFGTGGNPWPVAVASADPSGGDVPLSVDFSSAGSFDPNGTLSAYAWDFGDGATSTLASPTHFYTLGGPYVATLSVTDNGGAASMQEVLVQAVEPNVAPIAIASSDKTLGPVPLDVIFYATGSYDADGFIGNIEWTFPNGDTSFGSPAYYTFYDQGTQMVTLTVHDARGATGTDTVTVVTTSPNAPAAPSGLVAIAFTSDWINVTWTDNSNNEDGFKVERCQGTAVFCDANPSSFAEVAQVGPNIDYHADTGLPWGTTFSYRVRAFNATAASSYSNTSAATTLPPPPVAVIVPSVLGGKAPLTVQFDGRGSYDPDGTIVSWSWAFGDGGGASTSVATHTYLSPGLYLATLYVNSNDGAQDSAEVWIEAKSGSAGTSCGEAGTGAMLLLSKVADGGVKLAWGASCSATDNDYGVYEGSIGSFTSHVPVVCSTGGATTTTITPSAGSTYYLVAPNNKYYEGRYGKSSSGADIPHGPTRCYPQATTISCP